MRINEWCAKGKRSLKILVAGKVGVGKSSLINGLIGRQIAPEGDDVTSVTHTVNEYKDQINGVDVIIFDTPGLFDPEAHCDRETLQEICKKTGGTIDLLLICLKMTERIDVTHVQIIQKLKEVFPTDTVWKNTLLVLTFANEVHLPRTRGKPQPEDETKLRDYFGKRLSEFRTKLPEYLRHIPSHLLKEIPIVPAGYDEPNLPGYDDWLSKFWVKAFTRASDNAKPALLRISEGRFMENPNRERMPPHLRQISMQITWGAVVGAALGKAAGNIKTMFLHPRERKEIEEIRSECQRKGASLGARFVLYFYTFQNPLEHTIDWFLDQIQQIDQMDTHDLFEL